MASQLSSVSLGSQVPHFSHGNSFGLENRSKIKTSPTKSGKENEYYSLSRPNSILKFLFAPFSSLSRQNITAGAFSSVVSAFSDHMDNESWLPTAKAHDNEMEYSRVNCLVWVLHESARSFSFAIQSLELIRSGPELAQAWNGVDVHAWHKNIAYQVAVYALLKTAIKVEFLLSNERCNSPPVSEILSPKITMVEEYITNQLNKRHPVLVEWFRVVELPRIAGFFIPLFKKWCMEYAGSGVAGIILAISCCAAVEKLGFGRISCPLYTLSLENEIIELMNLSYSLVSVEKFYKLATEAGFEEELLAYLGKKILPGDKSEDLEFWIGLTQQKLCVAFHREGLISGIRTFSDKVKTIIHDSQGTGVSSLTKPQVQENSLATLGLFAFLGRETRSLLSRMGIKDLDEQVKDFLSYLECGSLFIYPELSSLSVYQLFMEIVIDEIGWLNFFAAYPCDCPEKRKTKPHVIQAEKEMILLAVFTVCYGVFSGFAHYNNTAQQPLDANLLAFLLRSQNLLTVCLEDYWAAYDRSGEIMGAEREPSEPPPPPVGTKITNKLSALSAHQNPVKMETMRCAKTIPRQGSKQSQTTSSAGMDTVPLLEVECEDKVGPSNETLLRQYSIKLVASCGDICMGTQLLFTDIMAALRLLQKKLRGQKMTKRERKKLQRTLSDIASLVPVTILMLLPVSVVGVQPS
ncbi:hypothetical protein RJ641_019971 [Dillenia turbinata]|uniref:Uncharacterized protein n=1 Tax=Dillenia turbinata TaxID=194707 RepID=A0AAN8UL82_9MAGN